MAPFLTRLNSNRPLYLLLSAFLALALSYSLVVPVFEGPDEDDHFRYAKFIADQRSLPVQLFEPGGGEAGHQGWQPPLYYALAALMIAPIDTSDFPQHLWRNRASTFAGDPSCCGRNLYYHADSENWPFARTTLAVHLVRLLSILFGAVTVAATYALAETLFPERRRLALATASVVAFNPSFLFASTLVSNDAPLAAFSTLILLVWVGWLTGKCALDLKTAALLGALIGLALLVKPSALGLIPLSMLVIAAVARLRRDGRLAIAASVVMLGVIVLLSGWWFARNRGLYGDPLALRLVVESALFPRAGPLTLPELVQISLPWLWQTFWGGPTPGDFSPVILVLLSVLALAAAVGVVLFVLRHSQFAVRSSFAVLGLWLAFILVAQIQFIGTTAGADQGRYLFPAISAFALFFVVGLTTLVRQSPKDEGQRVRAERFASLGIIAAFFLLALFVPFAYTLPAYARPALIPENDLAHLANPLDVNFADRMELLGFDLAQRSVKPGNTLSVTLYWKARAPMAESYRVFVHLIGQGDRSAGGVDVIPARGAFPTVYWKPGDTLRDLVLIPIAVNAAPGKYAVEVGLYPVGRPGERLAVTASGDDRAILGVVKVAPAHTVAYSPQTRVGANFADQIELTGYDSVVDYDRIYLTLYWRARSAVGRDYTTFVHALDEQGKIIAQVDRQPHEGNYPTSLWDANEQIRDEYVLSLPSNGRAANYRIALGLYRADTGERLPVNLGGNVNDHIELKLGAAP